MLKSTHPGPDLPPQPRAGLKFLLAAALVPIVVLSVVGIGLYSAEQRGPVQTTAGSATHIFFLGKRKDALAREAIGSRVMLFGGSGVLYSIRAESLASTLGAPVINMGVHAGLGLDYLFYRARNELRPNDIAVLFLEYGLYVKEKPDWTLADYAIPFDFRYLAHAGVGETIDLAGKITPGEYVQKIRGGWFGVPRSGAQTLAGINAAGDFIANNRSDQKDYHRKTLDEAGPFGGTVVNPTQSRKIVEFLEWCRRNGVHVVAGFPAFLDFPGYHVPPEEDFYFQPASLYRSQGVPLLGVPQEFMFPKAMFFDSSYHMNNDGAEVMTSIIARRLPRIARCDIYRDLGGNRRPECDRLRQHVVVDLAQDGLPVGVKALSGFSWREAWGRWTDGSLASLRINPILDVPFSLDLVVPYVFSEKAPLLVTVRAGTETRTFIAAAGRTSLEFKGSSGNDRIDISIPEQRSPKAIGAGGDERRIGLGIARLEIHPRAEP